MAARYPYYLLADSKAGREKEAEITGVPGDAAAPPRRGDVKKGFVYKRVPHVTLKAIANNDEIDVIYEHFQKQLEPLRADLNKQLGEKWEEWEIPREAGEAWPEAARALHREWWELRLARAGAKSTPPSPAPPRPKSSTTSPTRTRRPYA